MASDIHAKIDALSEELAAIRSKLEAIEEMLSEEELSGEEKADLDEAMSEHKSGKTIPLNEALRKLK